MSLAIRLNETVTDGVIATSVQFDPAVTKPTLFRYIADRVTHIEVGPATATAIIASSARIPADCAEFINVDPGQTLNFIRGTGETDGTVWITRIDRV